MYIMDLDTIHNAKYDPKSGRIEFNALGEGIFYNDYQAGVIRERWDLKEDFVAIFYDYTEPSLYEYLVFAERMISIHKKPINMGNLLSPKSISGKIDAWFFDSRRQLSCI